MADETGFTIVERTDLIPLCPHCGRDLPEVHRRSTGFPLFRGKQSVYFCPSCRKVLGFSQGRMA